MVVAQIAAFTLPIPHLATTTSVSPIFPKQYVLSPTCSIFSIVMRSLIDVTSTSIAPIIPTLIILRTRGVPRQSPLLYFLSNDSQDILPSVDFDLNNYHNHVLLHPG